MPRCPQAQHIGGRLLPLDAFPYHAERRDMPAPWCRACALAYDLPAWWPDMPWRGAVMPPGHVTVLVEALEASLELPGDVAEFGVFEGYSAEQLALTMRPRTSKCLHLFDTGEGLPTTTEDPPGVQAMQGYFAAPLHKAITRVKSVGVPCRAYEGDIRTTGPVFTTLLCFVHVDCDLYAGTAAALALCQRCLVISGRVAIHDYGTEWTGVTQAVDAHLATLDYAVERWPQWPTTGHIILRKTGDVHGAE